jgi:hypothetical protein
MKKKVSIARAPLTTYQAADFIDGKWQTDALQFINDSISRPPCIFILLSLTLT